MFHIKMILLFLQKHNQNKLFEMKSNLLNKLHILMVVWQQYRYITLVIF